MFAIEVGIVLLILAAVLLWALLARGFNKIGGLFRKAFIKPFQQKEDKPNE